MDYLTVAEAAKRLDASETSVRRWANEGKLPVVRVSRLGWRLIPAPAVEELARRRAAERATKRGGAGE
uniref:DNA-binding protein n=1 Tax=Thermorudis peleae TaxID=1382356 RepID=A0A831T7C2_9BACT